MKVINIEKINFTTEEAVISGVSIPMEVATKLWLYHLLPMQRVRDILGEAIWPSLKSGYRPEVWEHQHGRSGNSQHCFRGKGAVDWTAGDLDRLEKLIIEHTTYTRIARYATFIHCDHKPTADGRRQYFTSGSNSKWNFIKHL